MTPIKVLPAHLMPMVEKAAEEIASYVDCDWKFRKCESNNCSCRCRAREAILAFLNACLDGGVAEEGMGYKSQGLWFADSAGNTPELKDFPVLILNLGEAK